MAEPGYLNISNLLVSASWPFTFPSVSLSFTHIFHLTSTCFYSSSPHQSIPPPVQTPFHLLLTLTIDQVVWKCPSSWTLDWPYLICQPVCLSPLRNGRDSELIPNVILATPWPICNSYPTPYHCPAVQYQTYILLCHSWLHNAVPEYTSRITLFFPQILITMTAKWYFYFSYNGTRTTFRCFVLFCFLPHTPSTPIWVGDKSEARQAWHISLQLLGWLKSFYLMQGLLNG